MKYYNLARCFCCWTFGFLRLSWIGFQCQFHWQTTTDLLLQQWEWSAQLEWTPCLHVGVEPKIGGFYPQNGWWKSWKTLLNKWMIWGNPIKTSILIGFSITPMNKWMIWGVFPLFLGWHPCIHCLFFGSCCIYPPIYPQDAIKSPPGWKGDDMKHLPMDRVHPDLNRKEIPMLVSSGFSSVQPFKTHNG